ncbi:MAG: hypothetical protein Q9182_002864 [Xanthomendoza sp. 2 TL-2023]
MEDAQLQPIIGPIIFPYSSRIFATNLVNIEKMIEHYHRFQNDPNTCLGNASDEPCRECIETCLDNIAKILTSMLSMGPSLKVSEELDDFQKLSRVEKKFFAIEGRMGHFVTVLINRKFESVEGSTQAEMMSRKHWKNTGWITEKRESAGHQFMGESGEMKRAMQRLERALQGDSLFVRPVGGGEISSLPQLMDALRETLAEGRAGSAKLESGSDEEEQPPGEDSESSSSSTMDRVTTGTPSIETVYPSPSLDLTNNDSNEWSGEDTSSPPRYSEGSICDVVERDPATTRAPAPPRRLGNIASEGFEQDTYPPPRNPRESQSNSIRRPFSEASSTASKRIAAGAIEDEHPETPPRKIRRVDFNVFEREPSDVRVPAPPSFSVPASARGVMFDVVEREPSEARAPAPPTLRF